MREYTRRFIKCQKKDCEKAAYPYQRYCSRDHAPPNYVERRCPVADQELSPYPHTQKPKTVGPLKK